jgi:hypothetical protein
MSDDTTTSSEEFRVGGRLVEESESIRSKRCKYDTIRIVESMNRWYNKMVDR